VCRDWRQASSGERIARLRLLLGTIMGIACLAGSTSLVLPLSAPSLTAMARATAATGAGLRFRQSLYHKAGFHE